MLAGHCSSVFSLSRYPMALGNLGDLEEISPTQGRPLPLAIFQEAISSAVKYYNNHHVYPYTYMGGYMYRKQCYKEAIKCWAEASNVIRKYVTSSNIFLLACSYSLL